MFVLLLAPFAVLVVLGFWHGLTIHPPVQWGRSGTGSALSTAVLVAMWNYMGWDNASTVAQEVENPQRNYAPAMLASTLLVAVTYILPLAAVALAGLSVESFSTGDWTNAARVLGGSGPLGTGLGVAIVAGGAISGIGMFNALVMSYSRLPMTMALDGMLPRIFARRNLRGVPWVSVLILGLAWALALKLPFERLISIDLILYGSSLILEFVALAVLRVREPNLPRPFRAGSFFVTILLGAGPTALIIYALYASRDEKLSGSISALGFAVVVALFGPVFYWLTAVPLARRRKQAISN
jgi:amino acid transporter